MSQVSNVHGKARRVIVLLHKFGHLVAEFVNFHEGEIDVLGSKHSHLVLNLVAIRRTVWIAIITIADLFTVARCISNVEDGPN